MSKDKHKQHNAADHSSKSRFYHAFFKSIKGKEVKIYRGGPEAKHGKVIDVKSDYVALETKKAVIYYQAEHIKSISEPTKPKPEHHEHDHHHEKENSETHLSAKSFRKLLKKMEHKVIQLNQGGPESIHGELLSVKHDFLLLLAEDGCLVYVNLHHVKSVCQSSKSFKGNKEKMKGKRVKAHDLHGVFQQLKNKWVSINRGGPEAIEGVLFVDKGFYKLIRNEEVIRVDPFHIRSISSGPKEMKKDKGGDKHHKDGNKGHSDDKYKDCDFDFKDGKRGGRSNGKDRYKNQDDKKDKYKSDTSERYKDWFEDKSDDKKDCPFNYLSNDDEKDNQDKYDYQKNNDGKDDSNKDDNKDSKYSNNKDDNKDSKYSNNKDDNKDSKNSNNKDDNKDSKNNSNKDNKKG
ncbi:hypothetical protein [Bacillus tuaregi]|uniref:hypothetical protein n=1 Tax=Bacillus tuaregi TaxID=1816695 RepID=UPI0008F95081|nr:hypothetical protein [Bacillus tuaregi]